MQKITQETTQETIYVVLKDPTKGKRIVLLEIAISIPYSTLQKDYSAPQSVLINRFTTEIKPAEGIAHIVDHLKNVIHLCIECGAGIDANSTSHRCGVFQCTSISNPAIPLQVVTYLQEKGYFPEVPSSAIKAEWDAWLQAKHTI